MDKIFTQILALEVEQPLYVCPCCGKNKELTVRFRADGQVPYPQLLIWDGGKSYVYAGKDIKAESDYLYSVKIPAGILPAGGFTAQAEGCLKTNIQMARPHDWVKAYKMFCIAPAQEAAERAEQKEKVTVDLKGPALAESSEPKIYFGIHKHMHQPYYDAVDQSSWDDNRENIFRQRVGPYTRFVPAAIKQYIAGGLPNAGMSVSWSGSLLESLNRCQANSRCGGAFNDWSRDLRRVAQEKTALGNPRLDLSAFGFFHPLMPLIPGRDIVKQIARHRRITREIFGCDPSPILFPPETAFHVRMIPHLVAAGVQAVIYDSIHRSRACKDYPYGGPREGMLPPNLAEQENPPVNDWFQLRNVWSASPISTALLRPEYVKYEDPQGNIFKLIAIPAERYIGNEDARGGFGALQYPDIFNQLYQNLEKSGQYDPQHPPFFFLHSDGDNHGGGAESYYTNNTARLVEWLKSDPRFVLTTASDYLQLFPPDEKRAIHIEPGSWSGADNGDPQFMKWFSRYNDPYSPDLNSWAVLTALQNGLHTAEDLGCSGLDYEEAERLLLTAETSCYWYWTGQDVWDRQVTNAANRAWGIIRDKLANAKDPAGPTIFPPWVTPENPGGKTWGHGSLKDAPRQGVVHTFVYDVSGVKRVEVVLRLSDGQERRFAMNTAGTYPSQTGALVSADYYTCALPEGLGSVRYYLEAEDGCGNVSRSSLERLFLA